MILFAASVVAPVDCTLPITSRDARFDKAFVFEVEVFVASNRLPNAMQWIFTGLRVVENPPADWSAHSCVASVCVCVAPVANATPVTPVGNSVPAADRLLASASRTL